MADRHNIPKRMLFAAGWLESKLNPQAALRSILIRQQEYLRRKPERMLRKLLWYFKGRVTTDDSEEADLIEVQAEAFVLLGWRVRFPAKLLLIQGLKRQKKNSIGFGKSLELILAKVRTVGILELFLPRK
ncbi:MAG: hypothetical protein R3B45_01640 [Bdellovibrionota bacterium]